MVVEEKTEIMETMRLRKLITILPFLLASCLDDNPADTQLANEQVAIAKYLEGASFTAVTADNNSGIRIGVTSFGSGAPPHEGQTVTIIYTGRILSDWSIFETDTINAKLEKIPVRGLRFGIGSITEGTTATIFLASKFGFGTGGSSKVPGNTTIAYEVTLAKVVKTDAEQLQFKTDSTAIHTYLTDHTITTTALLSGIWYSTDSVGTGKSPNVYDLVTFHYKGTILSSGEIFQEGDISKQIVFSFIDGLKIGLPLIKTGTTATFYIPSGLAYGTKGSNLITANTNLIFEIKLNDVE